MYIKANEGGRNAKNLHNKPTTPRTESNRNPPISKRYNNPSERRGSAIGQSTNRDRPATAHRRGDRCSSGSITVQPIKALTPLREKSPPNQHTPDPEKQQMRVCVPHLRRRFQIIIPPHFYYMATQSVQLTATALQNIHNIYCNTTRKELSKAARHILPSCRRR